MKRSWKEFLRLLQFPAMIALGLFPVPVMIFTYLQPELQGYAWILPVAYFTLTVLSLFLPGKLRLPFGAIAAVGMVAPWCFFLAGENLGLCLAMAITFALMLLWSIRLGGWNAEKEIHSAWIGVCLCTQLLGQVVLFLDLKTVQHPLEPVATWIYASFFGTIILCMLSMNRKGLNAIATENSAVVRLMRRKNTLLVVSLVGVAAVFSVLPSLLGVIKPIVRTISQLVKLLERDLPDITPPSTTMPTEPEETGSGQFVPNVGVHTEILNISFKVFFVLFVLISLPFVVRFLWKRLSGVFKNLWNAMLTYTSDSMTDYEDEITDTRDTVIKDEVETVEIKRRRIFPERGMSATERIRYRYRQLQKKNPQWLRASTARENLPVSSAEIYERARYSPHPITAADAEQFKSETKKM